MDLYSAMGLATGDPVPDGGDQVDLTGASDFILASIFPVKLL
jgi:hypothetical protein